MTLLVPLATISATGESEEKRAALHQGTRRSPSRRRHSNLSTKTGQIHNPDWAYVEEVEGKERVYFVMETRDGGNGTPNLRPTEKAKIECVQKHFEALAIDDVVYDLETTYHYAIL